MTDPFLYTFLKLRIRSWRMAREVSRRRPAHRPHGLPAPLIVSLTSYPARFSTLHLTVAAALRQTVRADRLILTLTDGDETKLPDAVLRLQDEGLEIRTSDRDIKSYTKLIPVLRDHPDAFIVTCDDDVYHPCDWLEDLVTCAKRYPGRIISHRAHRVGHDDEGLLLSYEEWEKNIDGTTEGPDIFATGVGGVLYPPDTLDPMVLDADRFMRLCPSADDIWFYWMARRRGTLVRHAGPKTRVIEWNRSADSALQVVNRGLPYQNGNDRAIRALTCELGLPGSR